MLKSLAINLRPEGLEIAKGREFPVVEWAPAKEARGRRRPDSALWGASSCCLLPLGVEGGVVMTWAVRQAQSQVE